MSSIFLRIPTYLAQYYRNRDTKHQLTEFQPVVFHPFEHESVIIESWLMFIHERSCEQAACFSQRMWTNMLKGKHPQGGKTIINRDADQWLTLDEVNTLNSIPKNSKYANCEYLAIQAPRTVTIGGETKVVTPSYTLPAQAAADLVREMRQNFVRKLLRWIRDVMTFCDVQGIRRDLVMTIDLFFNHYSIMEGITPTDRDTLRRMAMRWLEEARLLPEEIDDEDVKFIYERERQNMDISIDTMLKSVTQNVNTL